MVEDVQRKKYMRDVYSDYWKDAREKIYGFSEYDRWLCQHVMEDVPRSGRILEVAIGTGFPVADFLKGKGFEVCGVDISSLLLQECLKRIGGSVTVTDAENLGFVSQSFELAYCFHSTWYFPNLTNVLREMARVTRSGGIMSFDILNSRNDEIKKGYERNVARSKGVLGLTARALILLRRMSGRPTTSLKPVVHEVPTDPSIVHDFCQKEGKAFKVFDKSGVVVGPPADRVDDEYQSHSRLIFDVVV